MKANKKQTILIDKLIEGLGWLKKSNDITSPTHYGDFDDSLMELLLDNEITDEDRDKFCEIFSALYTRIKLIH